MDFTETRKEHWVNEDGIACVTDSQEAMYNINHHVRVKLTNVGFNHWFERRKDRLRSSATLEHEYMEFLEEFAIEFNCHYISNGWCEFQMFHLLGLFGNTFNVGAGLHPLIPFETNIILVEHDMKILDTVAQA